MSVRTDTVNLIVNVNGNSAQANLGNLRKQAADLRFEMQGLVKGTAEYAAKATQLKSVTAEMDTLKKSIGLTALSQKELTAELNKLKALRGSVVPFSDEYNKLSQSIGEVQTRLNQVKTGSQGFSSMLAKLGDSVKQFGVLAAAYLGFQFITNQFKNIINGAAKLSDQLADLRRVSGLTADEASNLNKKLTELDTRTSTEGLRNIAIIAGKLGVAKEDILDFTKAVDQLVVSLGDELGNADQITTSLGKILNVFDGKVTGDSISKLGNAFVELANSGVATGGFIADFDQRLSGIAKSAGISLGALSGLGAGLEETGSRVESSSTAIQKLIVKIASDIPAAAKVAGLSAKDFNKLFATDGTEAILKYSEGLVKNKKAFAEIVNSLKDAGEEGARTIETITKLGSNADLLRQRIDLGKKSIEESSAITAAFALKNETFGASLEKIGKEINLLTTSSGLTTFLKSAAEEVLYFIQALKKLPQFIDDNSLALKLLITGIALLNFGYIKSAALIALDTILKIKNAIATKAVAIATATAEVAQASYIVVTNLLAGRIALATAAQRLWSLALSVGLGPLGVIVTLIGTAVIAFNAFASANSNANKTLSFQAETIRETNTELAKQKGELQSLTSILNDNNVSSQTRGNILKQLVAISPEYLNRLTLENLATAEGKRILDNYNKSLETSGNLKAANTIRDREAQKDANLRTIKQELEIAKSQGKGFGDLSTDAQNAFSKVSTSVGRTNITSSLLNASISKEDFKIAFEDINKEIDAQSKNVQAATANFLTQTQAQQDARRGFLLHEITASRAAQNVARDEVNKYKENTKEYIAANAAYQKSTLNLISIRKKFDDEFGNKNKETIAPGLVTPPADDAKKEADKAAKEHKLLLEEAAKFEADLKKLKERVRIKGEEPEQAEIDTVTEKYKVLTDKAKEYFFKHAIYQKQYGVDEKLITEAQTKELQNIFEKYYKKRFEENSASEYEASLTARTEFSNKLREIAAADYASGKLDKINYENTLKQIDKNETADRIIIAKDYSDTVKKAAKDVTEFRKTQEKKTTEDLLQATEARKQLTKDEQAAQLQRNILITKPGSKANLDAIKAQIEAERQLAIQGAKDKYAALGIVLQDSNAIIQNINAEFDKKRDQADSDHIQGLIDKYLKYASFIIDVWSNLNTFLNNRDNAQFNKEKALNDKKKLLYKQQLDSKLLSQQQYDKKVTAIDEAQDKKQRELAHKQAEREKILNLFNAVVSNAAAIVKTMTSVPYPFNIPLAIAQGIAGGLQIAAIANTPLPELGTGDWIRTGAKHKDKEGGIPVMIERDEAVIKAAAMTSGARYTVTGTTAQITSALNSRAGGVNWAGGALVQMPAWRSAPVQNINPNMPRIMEQGGIVRPLDTNNVATLNNDQLMALLKMHETMQQILEVTKDKNESLHAVVSIKEFDKKRAELNQAKKVSGLW
ncbi:phage tail tape measure protein [soil metagenome]